MKNSAFITGGSRGLGYFLSKKFLSKNIDVFSCSRKNSDLVSHNGFKFLNVDLGLDNIDILFDSIEKNKSVFNIVVLNAAVTGVYEVDEQNYSVGYVNNVNIESNKKILANVLPSINDNKGIIVFVTTDLNILDLKDYKFDLYLKSKATFEKYISEVSKNYPNIKFLVFNPGIIYTNIQLNILKNGDDYLKSKFFENFKKGNVKTPEMVSNIIYEVIIKILNSNITKNLYYINISKEYKNGISSYLDLI